MKIVLLRHAARSPHDFGDSALSALGRSQAEALAISIAPQGPLPAPTILFASPKKRARETLDPLAEATHLPLTTDPLLDERRQNETGREFESRIAKVIERLTLPPANTRDSCAYLCTHLDWLESVVQLLPSDLSESEAASGWSNCEYRIFKLAGGIWTFTHGGIIKGGG